MGDKLLRGAVAIYAMAYIGLAVSAGVSVSAQSVAADTRPTVASASGALVTLDVTDAKLEDVLRMIAWQAGLKVFGTNQSVPVSKRITLHLHEIPASEALDRLFAGTAVKALVDGRLVILKYDDAASALAAQGGISGKVIDGKTKVPLGGVTVMLDKNTKGVVSGSDGEFHLGNVTPGEHTLRMRVLGYSRVTKAVTVTDGQTATVEVALEPSVNMLGQVVVTGTVIPTELKAVSNAVTIITAKEIEQRGITRIDQLLHGAVPGMFAGDGGEAIYVNPGYVANVASRGLTGLYGVDEKMKTYVDGVEMSDPHLIGLIDPRSIERIEIVTGPQAATIYGSNAINGVMQIFTKRGTTPRPQVVVNLGVGFISNQFSSGLAPQHSDAVQLSGVQGMFSYNIGSSVNYTGPWSPAIHSLLLGGYAGVRFQHGPVSGDVSLFRSQGRNRQDALPLQANAIRETNGDLDLNPADARKFPEVNTTANNTAQLSLNYAPMSWWSQTVRVGTNESSQESVTQPSYLNPDDTGATYNSRPSTQLTMGYNTTLQLPLMSSATAIITLGGDGSNARSQFVSANLISGNGGQLVSPYGSRQVSHDRGAFAQGRLGLWDAVFVTYGVRAQWNPNYGKNVSPNVEPKYGIAMTQAFGAITTKVRGSYGTSTRPPNGAANVKIRQTNATWIAYYGPYDTQSFNPELLPDDQKGWEGGLEVYVGNRVSMQVTRYNQTVNNLAQYANTDSVDFLPWVHDQYGIPAWKSGYYVYIQEWLNLGSVRNQGWEWQGTVTTGPVTTHGVYSYTKSRLIGITPKYKKYFPGLVAGSTFNSIPEHTWAMDVTYARGGTTLSYNVQGQGELLQPYSLGIEIFKWNNSRLDANAPRIKVPKIFRDVWPGYAKGDVNVSQRLTSRIDGTAHVDNVWNSYQNDYAAGLASLGRRVSLGLRLRW